MTPADIVFALGLVDIHEGNTTLTDFIFDNISRILSSVGQSGQIDLISNTARIYIWAWLMIGYRLGSITEEPYARDVSKIEILPVYTKVFKELNSYDETLLVPINERLERIDSVYINEGSTSLFRNMIAVMATWLCEVGMIIARKPHVLKVEFHYME